jgi:hypothetical protein
MDMSNTRKMVNL